MICTSHHQLIPVIADLIRLAPLLQTTMTSQSTNFITKATNAAASLVSVAGSLANTAAESFGYYGEKTVLGTFGTLEKVPQGTRSHLPFVSQRL